MGLLASLGLAGSPASAVDVVDSIDERVTLPRPTIEWAPTSPNPGVDSAVPRVGDVLTFSFPPPTSEGQIFDLKVEYYYGLVGNLNQCGPSIRFTDDRVSLQKGNWSFAGSSDPPKEASLSLSFLDIGKFPCAFYKATWNIKIANSSNPTRFTSRRGNSRPTGGPPVYDVVAPTVPLQPLTPYVADGTSITPGAVVTFGGRVIGDTPQDLVQRDLGISIMTSESDSCQNVRPDDVRRSEGAGTIFGGYQIPSGSGGKFVCVQQRLTSSQGTKVSPPLFLPIDNADVSVSIPRLSLSDALQRLNAATRDLADLQRQPDFDRGAILAAAAEAEAARQAAEAAARQNQAGTTPNNQGGNSTVPGATPTQTTPTTPAEAQEAQAAIDRAAEQIGEAVGATTVGSGLGTTYLTQLMAATGFDPLATPVLNAETKNASGVSISVTTRSSIRQKKRLRAYLRVLDPVTRGGMRMYLVSLVDGQPKLMLKRTGFVPRGVKKKRFWISKRFMPGTYGLLTTFKPSTPGLEGVATYDVIEVTKAKKRKKKRR